MANLLAALVALLGIGFGLYFGDAGARENNPLLTGLAFPCFTIGALGVCCIAILIKLEDLLKGRSEIPFHAGKEIVAPCGHTIKEGWKFCDKCGAKA